LTRHSTHYCLQPILNLRKLSSGANGFERRSDFIQADLGITTKNTLDLARLAIPCAAQTHSGSLQRLTGTGLNNGSLNGGFLSRRRLLWRSLSGCADRQ
jgi:hypothetical protein